MHRSLQLALVATLPLLLAACVPPWAVIRQATPNPFIGQSAFAVAELNFDGLRVGEKSEQAYLSAKDQQQQGSFATDKVEMAANFTETLKSSAAGLSFSQPGAAAGYTVRPHVVWIEPGFYAYVAAHPTEVVMKLQLLDAKGALMDDIEVRVSVAATIANPSSGGRLREAGRQLGAIAADYLRQRVVQ